MSETSLQEVRERGDWLPKPARLSILQQVAEEIDQAHRRNILHGHLTPMSIMISQEGSPPTFIATVTDFGTKFVLDNEILADRMPQDVHYISPEQVLGIDIGERSDLFSLAVIAYELVCGKKPFEADAISPLFYKICTEPAESVERIDPSLTEDVNWVFKQAMAKKPERRYPTARDFVQSLATTLLHCEGWYESPMTEPYGAYVASALPNPAAASAFSSPAAAAPPPSPPPPAPPPWPQMAEPEMYVPPSGGYELPTLQRRRRRYFDEAEEEEAYPTSGSRNRRLIVAAAIALFLGGATVFFSRWTRAPSLPVQVLDTKNGPTVAPNTSGPNAPPSSTAPIAQQPVERAASPNSATSAAPQTPNAQVQQPPAGTDTPSPAAAPPQSQSQAPEPPQSTPSQPAPNSNQATPNAQIANPSPSAPIQQPRRAPERPPNTPEHSRNFGGETTASVELLTIPPGGRIVIDNNPLMTCTAPCTMSLSSGRHTLSAQLTGFAAAHRVFNVPEESTQTITLGRQTGTLVVTSRPPSATILVDGTKFGLTPSTLHLSPGQHRVTMLNGNQMHEEVVNVAPDGIQSLSFVFPQQ